MAAGLWAPRVNSVILSVPVTSGVPVQSGFTADAFVPGGTSNRTRRSALSSFETSSVATCQPAPSPKDSGVAVGLL